MTKKEELAELRGIAKILDVLWYDSFNVRRMDERLREELEYYFGKDWNKTMYEFANMTGPRAPSAEHPEMPRPLKEITQRSKPKQDKR